MVYQWNKGNMLCKRCNSQMFDVTDGKGNLIAARCKECGEFIDGPGQREKREQWQREANDNYDYLQKQERIRQRLEFKEGVSPYPTGRAKWVKAGHRRRVKVKKLFILFGAAFVVTSLILIFWHIINFDYPM